MQYLRCSDLAWRPDGLLEVNFPYHKGDPFKLGTTQLVSFANDPMWGDRVRRYLLTKEPSAYLTTLTTDTTVEALKRVNGLLTAHSVKRGALLRGLQSGVSLEQLRILAKHKDLQMLLSYLPKADVAKALGMHEVTALL